MFDIPRQRMLIMRVNNFFNCIRVAAAEGDACQPRDEEHGVRSHQGWRKGQSREDEPERDGGQHGASHGAALRVVGTDGVDHVIEATAFPLEGSRGRLLGAVAMFWERDR